MPNSRAPIPFINTTTTGNDFIYRCREVCVAYDRHAEAWEIEWTLPISNNINIHTSRLYAAIMRYAEMKCDKKYLRTSGKWTNALDAPFRYVYWTFTAFLLPVVCTARPAICFYNMLHFSLPSLIFPMDVHVFRVSGN